MNIRRQQDTTKNRHHLLTYLLPILLFAVLFNITKFFESKVPSRLWNLCFSSINVLALVCVFVFVLFLVFVFIFVLVSVFLVLIVLDEKLDFSVRAIISASESFLREEGIPVCTNIFRYLAIFSKILPKSFHCGNLL